MIYLFSDKLKPISLFIVQCLKFCQTKSVLILVKIENKRTNDHSRAKQIQRVLLQDVMIYHDGFQFSLNTGEQQYSVFCMTVNKFLKNNQNQQCIDHTNIVCVAKFDYSSVPYSGTPPLDNLTALFPGRP